MESAEMRDHPPVSNEVEDDTCADNTALLQLSAESIIDNMRRRYKQDKIYTYTASVLLAANPNRQISGLYGEDVCRCYRGKHLGALPPHPYAIADNMYRALAHPRDEQAVNQAVLISGESGAGKTETAKIVMQYLAHESGASSDLAAHMQDRVLRAQPILESFGNAVTLRNHNSSRFGKYNRMHFDPRGRLIGASITTYLLESSRVVVHGEQERTYHVFYEMLAGLDEASLAEWGLARDGKYALMHNWHNEPTSESDSDHFKRLREALLAVGLAPEEISSCLQILAGLIHLGDFLRDAEATVQEEIEAEAETPVDMQCESISYAARLLGMDDEELIDAVRWKKIAIPGRESFTKVPRSAPQFRQVLRGLIKALYKRLFEYIVSKINASFQGVDPGDEDKEVQREIGILDIYGFERLRHNSFEQLCINLANERLQQYFVENVLRAEQQLYAREGLSWTDLKVPNSEPAVHCINQVFGTLDDFSLKMAKGFDTAKFNDDTFCARLLDDAHKEPSQVLRRQKASTRGRLSDGHSVSCGFTVHHYAGSVDYTTSGWLDKNNDRLLPECESLIRDSQQPLVCSLSDEDRSATTFRSVSKRYTTDLESLLKILGSCKLHYIRCFKPNSSQAAGEFDDALVLEQIIQCGTVELVRIMHDGFPNRIVFEDLMRRFKAMLPESFQRYGQRTFLEALMRAYKVPRDQWALGFTKLFLKAGRLQTLEAIRDEGACPEASDLSDIIRDIVRRKWRRAFQAICISRWLPKFVADVREARRKRSIIVRRRWRGACTAIRWCLTEAAKIHRVRRDKVEGFLYHTAIVCLMGKHWVRRARRAIQDKERRAAEEAAARRLAEEAEARRLAEEAEERRLIEEGEARRLAEETEARRLAEEAEHRRLTEEAEERRRVEEAEARRLADETARSKAAEKADETTRGQEQAQADAQSVEAMRLELMRIQHDVMMKLKMIQEKNDMLNSSDDLEKQSCLASMEDVSQSQQHPATSSTSHSSTPTPARNQTVMSRIAPDHGPIVEAVEADLNTSQHTAKSSAAESWRNLLDDSAICSPSNASMRLGCSASTIGGGYSSRQALRFFGEQRQTLMKDLYQDGINACVSEGPLRAGSPTSPSQAASIRSGA